MLILDNTLPTQEMSSIRFRLTGLKLKWSKCHMAQSTVTILGHFISMDGVHSDPSKVTASVLNRLGRFWADVLYILQMVLQRLCPSCWDAAPSHLQKKWTAFHTLKTTNHSISWQESSILAIHRPIATCSRVCSDSETELQGGSDFLCQPCTDSIRESGPCLKECCLLFVGHYIAFTTILHTTPCHRPQVFSGWKQMPLENTGRCTHWFLELDVYDWWIVHRDGDGHHNAQALSWWQPNDIPNTTITSSRSTQIQITAVFSVCV